MFYGGFPDYRSLLPSSVRAHICGIVMDLFVYIIMGKSLIAEIRLLGVKSQPH